MAHEQQTNGLREAEALRRLEIARREDAKDASLPPCKLCGAAAVRDHYGGCESMSRGRVTVRCSKCDQTHTYSMDQIRPPYLTWEQAEAKVMAMWRGLNA